MSTVLCKGFNMVSSLQISFSYIYPSLLFSGIFITVYYLLMSSSSTKTLISFHITLPRIPSYLVLNFSYGYYMLYRRSRIFPYQMFQICEEAACCGRKSMFFVRKTPSIINYVSILNGDINICFIESYCN